MHWNRIGVVAVAAVLAVGLQAKGKKPKSASKDPQDEIAVASVIELKNHPVRRFIATPHYSRSYLYAEHADGSMTLIDVTDTAHPSVLAEVPAAAGGPSTAIVAVAGTAALVTDEGGSTQSALPVQTIRIVDFSDPRRPATLAAAGGSRQGSAAPPHAPRQHRDRAVGAPVVLVGRRRRHP